MFATGSTGSTGATGSTGITSATGSYSYIVSGIATDFGTILKGTPTAPRFQVVTTAGQPLQINISYGGTTYNLAQLSGQVFSIAPTAPLVAGTTTFTTTGVADTCSYAFANSAMNFTATYVDPVQGNMREILSVPQIGTVWQTSLGYIDMDTIYNVNQANIVVSLTSYTNPSSSSINLAIQTISGVSRIISLSFQQQ